MDPQTIATAIRIGAPASFDRACQARDESGGSITAETDEEILNAYRMIAKCEGIFVEPASAASIAGILKAHSKGEIVRGNGLKDPDNATKGIEIPRPVDANIDEVMKIIDGLK